MKQKKLGPFLLIVTFAIALLFAVPALAQEPDFDRINNIAKQLNCPTCAGINLADCRTLTCEQWREQIADLVSEGYSDQEVLDYFSARFGPQVLQEPPRSGSTLILWVLPVIAVIAGIVILVYTIRSWARREPPPGEQHHQEAPSTPISDAAYPPDAFLEQVEQDLEREDK